MKFCLLDADYEVRDGKPVIILIGVDAKGNRAVVEDSFLPYFYATKAVKAPGIVGMEKVLMKLGGKEQSLVKVYVDLPQNVQKVRDMVKGHSDCYEYSVNFCKRYLIDKGFYPLGWLSMKGGHVEKSSGGSPPLHILAFDMEVVDGKIVMISFATHGSKGVITYKDAPHVIRAKDEKDMLEKLFAVMEKEKPHIIVTYNGDGYDFNILRQRMEELKIAGPRIAFEKHSYMSSARVSGFVHIDLYNFVNNLIFQQLASEVYTLAEVSEELLGRTKKELSYEDIINMWKDDVNALSEYCLNDSVLTLELSDRLLPQLFELCRVSGQLPFDCSRLTYGLLVEWFLMRKAAEMKIIHPNPPHWDEIQKRRLKRFRGGYVKEPVRGLHDGIAVFDFRSLYPSIIVTFNISPETLNCRCCSSKVPGLEYHFCRKRKGFVPSVLEEVLQRRQAIKKKMNKAKGDEFERLGGEQTALKLVANSTYGLFGSPSARWYCFDCGQAAAAYGRHFIQKTIKSAEKNGLEVLYGDTDSLFVKAGDAAAKKFLRKMNSSLPGVMELDLQGIYARGLFVPQKLGNYTAKKRYALLDSKGNMTVRGLETVRKDWCDMARKLQHEVLHLVLQKKENDAVRKVREAVENVRKRQVSMEDIVMRTQMGKSLEEYKSTGPHIEVAKRLKAEGRNIHEGMVISYVITKGHGSISQRAMPADKVGIRDYDIEYYTKNQVLSVALRVLQVFGYKEGDFLAGGLRKFTK
ncbi:MAG: ribonuclease H-like domain-containing protein [Candidatus Aenigmarchaeota archaeon]|nr:ribonuclease H-like domain-containing protein [Candidatus Aenigmarchaeota archaeon]